jgi:hypothetical protein
VVVRWRWREVRSIVRIVGYVREPADGSRSAYAQQEELRRHAAAHGDALVAICQDIHSPDGTGRDGYLSLLGVVAAGGVDAVVVAGLHTFSADVIVQEIVVWDLRGRGVAVVSTDPSDARVLDPATDPEPGRLLIRDVLDRVRDHARRVGGARPEGAAADVEVLVEIMGAEEPDTTG